MHTAVLIAPLYEDVELIYPYYRLVEAGYDVTVVGPEAATYTGKRGTSMAADADADGVDTADLDGILIPGGYAPDHMRRDPDLVALVAAMGRTGKPVGAICHAPWMLASAGLVGDRTVTSFPSIRDDLVHAGGSWVDQETVRDGNIVTARGPDDLPAFMRMFLALLEGEIET